MQRAQTRGNPLLNQLAVLQSFSQQRSAIDIAVPLVKKIIKSCSG